LEDSEVSEPVAWSERLANIFSVPPCLDHILLGVYTLCVTSVINILSKSLILYLRSKSDKFVVYYLDFGCIFAGHLRSLLNYSYTQRLTDSTATHLNKHLEKSAVYLLIIIPYRDIFYRARNHKTHRQKKFFHYYNTLTSPHRTRVRLSSMQTDRDYDSSLPEFL
jgi:hypothetical protein